MSAETRPIRIPVADDHPVVRQGVAGLVDGQPDMSIVGQASNGREAIQHFRTHHPDLVLDRCVILTQADDLNLRIRNNFRQDWSDAAFRAEMNNTAEQDAQAKHQTDRILHLNI